MNFRLDKVVIELVCNTRRALLKALQIIRSLPIVQAALGVKLRALVVKTMTDFMPDSDTN